LYNAILVERCFYIQPAAHARPLAVNQKKQKKTRLVGCSNCI